MPFGAAVLDSPPRLRGSAAPLPPSDYRWKAYDLSCPPIIVGWQGSRQSPHTEAAETIAMVHLWESEVPLSVVVDLSAARRLACVCLRLAERFTILIVRNYSRRNRYLLVDLWLGGFAVVIVGV